MRFLSVMLGLLCLPVLLLAILFSPIAVPVLLLVAANVSGFEVWSKTSSPRSWNLASFHSPHSLTWRWLLSVSLDGIGWHNHGPRFGFYPCRKPDGLLQWSFVLPFLSLIFHQQKPMWYRDMYQRARDEQDFKPSIERLARASHLDKASCGAAARELCRSLGVHGVGSTLQYILEGLLAESNRASHDRHMILAAFDRVDRTAAQAARMESFHRNNPHIEPTDTVPVEAMPAAIH